MLDQDKPTLAIVDGLTEAYALHGLNPDSAGDNARWLALLPRWLMGRGLTVIQLDHVSKDAQTRGRWPTGSQHKLAGVYVSYAIQVREHFGRARAGAAAIKVVKDRPGHVRQFASDGTAAIMRLASDEAGQASLTFEPPESEQREPFRPTGLMERISMAIERTPGLSTSGVRSAVGGRNTVKELALRTLIAEGYVERRVDQDDGRKAQRHYSVKPYRKADDNHAPTQRGGVGGQGSDNPAPPRPDPAPSRAGGVTDTPPHPANGYGVPRAAGRGSEQPEGAVDPAPARVTDEADET